jgi:hypothetical protein
MWQIQLRSAGWKFKEALLMQNLFLVGNGPSLKICPKCASHFEHCTSVRIIPGFLINNSRLAPTLYMVLGFLGKERWGKKKSKKEKIPY